jgi:hypothetical protein
LPALAAICAAGTSVFTLAFAGHRREDGPTLRIAWVVLAGLAIAVGCEAPDPELAPVRGAIITGTPQTGDPAIMSLLSFRGQQGARCTATLITPRLLLAAAHCLTETAGFQQRSVYPGSDDRNGNVPEPDQLAVKSVVYDTRYGRPRQGNDFSIIVLETPQAIRPIPLNRSSLAAAVGKPARYVGYGLAAVGNPGSGGVKRQNTAPLADVSPLLLMIGPNAHQTCEGDSGGPLLMDTGKGEVLIGVGSFVDAPACRNNAFYQRVDTQLAWIDEQIQKLDPGGMAPAPAADAGLAEAGPPGSPDAGAAEAGPGPLPPAGGQPDTRPSQPDSGAPAPTPPSGTRDASAPRPPSMPPTEPANHADAGGCSLTPGAARPAGESPPAIVGLLFVLAWITRRRSVPLGPGSPGRPARRR